MFLPISVPAHSYFCTTPETLKEALEVRKKEWVAGRGVSGNSAIKLYVNDLTGAFSYVIDLPEGFSCIILVGTDWEFIYREASHEDEDIFPDPD